MKISAVVGLLCCTMFPAGSSWASVELGDVQGVWAQAGKDGKVAVTPATRAKVMRIFKNLRAQGFAGVQWTKWLPVGVRYVRVPLAGVKFADGYGYDALIPAEAVAPGAPALDPNKADFFILSRSGGLAGMTFYSGRIQLK